MGKWWDEDKTLWLLTPEEFSALPVGTVLTDIDGEKSVKGKDKVEHETRFGHLAYGLVEGQEGFPK